MTAMTAAQILDHIAQGTFPDCDRRSGIAILKVLRDHTGTPVPVDTLYRVLPPDGTYGGGIAWIAAQGIHLRFPGFVNPKVILP